MGAHNLVVSEITEEYPKEKGEAYLKCVKEEFDAMADEGAKESMEKEPRKKGETL